MTACNARPPDGHPLHDWGVACHLAEDHLVFGEAHSWDIDAVVARHEIVARAFDALLALFPGRRIEQFDAQLPHPLAVYDVDPETGARKPLGARVLLWACAWTHPYRRWDMAAGPWLVVTFEGGEEFAIWKTTGAVYRVGAYGAVDDDPIIEP